MARTSCGFPLSAKTEVREATRSPSTLARASISSSVIPSLRYSLSGSGLAFTKGRTAMPRAPLATARPRGAAPAVSADTKSATLAKRCAGSLARARASAASTAVPTSGRRRRTEGAGSATCRARSRMAAPPVKGGSPASISKTTQAKL